MADSVRRQREPIRYPKRQSLRLGPQGLKVMLSPEDLDLCRLSWYLHPDGYVWHREYRTVKDRKICTRVTWLHREVAKRVCELRGVALPRRVVFLNGARLDCRRENLKIGKGT